MAWQIRATATNNSAASASNQATVTIPAATQAGDYILECVVASGTSITQTTPGGWTAITAMDVTNSSSALHGAYRRAQAGDANMPLTFQLSASGRWSVILIVIYDNAGGVPRIEQVTTSTANPQTTSPTTPSIDPHNNDDLLLAVIGGLGNANGTQPTLSAVASGYTLQAQTTSAHTTLKNVLLGVATQILANGNVVPTATHTAALSIAPVGASILISSHNTPPNANAGPDQSVGPGATVTLNGTGSNDPDGSISSYSWQQLSGTSVTLSDPAAVQPTFTAPSSVEATSLVFGLTVTDNEGTPSAQDTVTVNVSAVPYQSVWNGGTMVKQPSAIGSAAPGLLNCRYLL